MILNHFPIDHPQAGFKLFSTQMMVEPKTILFQPNPQI